MGDESLSNGPKRSNTFASRPRLLPDALLFFLSLYPPFNPIISTRGRSCCRAREELPALRRDLCNRTKNANSVIAKQCGSAAGAGYAKAERDLTDEFVKLQVHVRFDQAPRTS